MRRVVVSEFVTLDGVMEAPDHWSFPFWNDEAAKFKSEELFASDALLLGRVTYEGFAAAWPSRSGGGPAAPAEVNAFADRMNSIAKYVVSTTLHQAAWNNSTIIGGNVADEVAKLKARPGRDILVGGSAQLVQTLLRHGLVDAYRLLVYPVVRGGGKRLFAEGSAATLRLVDATPFSSGVVALTYQPVTKEGER